MTPLELHQRLRERFGDRVADWQDPAVGDPSVTLDRDVLHDACAWLRDDPATRFDYLRLVSAVDTGEVYASVYHLYSYVHGHGLVLRVDLDRDQPRVASVADLWSTADWMECECYDMMGIQYEGHPHLRRLLLPLDWDGFPLRKDYTPPEGYHGIEHG